MGKDEGRGGQIAEHRPRPAGIGEGQAHQSPVPQKPQIGPQHGRGGGLDALVLRMALRQHEGDQRQRQPHQPGQYGEDQPPAADLQDQAARQGGEQGRDPPDQDHHGQQLGRLGPGVLVPHHRPGNGHARAGAQPLQGPERDQAMDVRREHAADGSDQENGQPHLQGPLAPEGVGQGAIDQLPHRHGAEEHHQGQLHLGGPGMQVRGHGRKGRQVHVDGQRPDGGDQSQQGRRPTQPQTRRRQGGGRCRGLGREGSGHAGANDAFLSPRQGLQAFLPGRHCDKPPPVTHDPPHAPPPPRPPPLPRSPPTSAR